jgi:protein tyrosine phosphatase (PTP) superfamily phosphohydrolase (DUF442 family)
MNRQPPPESRWFVFVGLAGLLICWNVLASIDEGRPLRQEPLPSVTSLSADGLENLWALPLPGGQRLYCGAQPEGDAGFRSLHLLGVRTVISVDGARPDLETARKFGLRYVHLPIGYDGVPPERLRQMVEAIRSLQGPFYVHCHHGKHRGPASAVCIWRQMNSRITPERGRDAMREMGTHPKYAGLYRSVELVVPDLMTGPAKPANFPEISAISPLARQMVGIDQNWEQLQAAAREAPSTEDSEIRFDELWVDLAEQFRESARLMESEQYDAEQSRSLRNMLKETADAMEHAESIKQTASRADDLRLRVNLLESRCALCHENFRDGGG